jgi:peptidoglycan/xylan/chitin deacetylase (PgdA/CDA1 family)
VASLCREAAGAAVYWSGAGRAFEAMAQPTGAIILMYHSVADAETADSVDPAHRLPPPLFERQMAFLSGHRRVVPLSQLVEQVASGTPPAAGTVCITFDDGYLDNFTMAAPILDRYKLPATLFLATGYVERGEAQWADTLHWLLARRSSDRLSLPSIGLVEADLASRARRAAVRRLLHGHLLVSTLDERTRLLSEIQQQLAPAGRLPRLTLNWDEVRQLRSRFPLFEIGGHTRDHVDLRTHVGAAAQAEIAGCAEDLRRELGPGPRHFSFPYARWCAETRDKVRAMGWKSAVGMGSGLRIGPASDRFAMPRLESPVSMTELRFKTSGAYPGALSMLGLI